MAKKKAIDIELIQKNLLAMFKMVKKIFDENNIPYCLTYGTLIGAIRHSGFIPWDDDLDMSVDTKYYEKAMQLLREKLPDYIIVHDKKSNPKYWLPYSQIVYKRSSTINTLWPENNAHPYTGIGIDIFRHWEEKKHSKYTAHLHSTVNLLQNLITNVTSHRGFAKFIRIIKYSLLFCLLKAKHFFSSKSNMYCMDPVMLSKPIYPEDIEETILHKFEDTEALVPKGYDRFLTSEFGNYMELPPLKDRQSHYSVVEISKNVYDMEDYESYI